MEEKGIVIELKFTIPHENTLRKRKILKAFEKLNKILNEPQNQTEKS